jgi:hypothetical protein
MKIVDFSEEEIKELLLAAGFRIYGSTVVAADNGSSGLATVCARKLIELTIQKVLTDEETNDVPTY